MKTITLTPDASGMVDWPTLSNDKKSVVTIGSFDGMHQGHQAVIRRVVELAKKEQSFSVVVLFDPRPALVHGYAAQNGGQEPPAGSRHAGAHQHAGASARHQQAGRGLHAHRALHAGVRGEIVPILPWTNGGQAGHARASARIRCGHGCEPCRRCEGHRESGARHRRVPA